MKKLLPFLLLSVFARAHEHTLLCPNSTPLQEESYVCAQLYVSKPIGYPGDPLGISVRGVFPVFEKCAFTVSAGYTFSARYRTTYTALAIDTGISPPSISYTVSTKYGTGDLRLGFRRYLLKGEGDQLLLPYLQGGLGVASTQFGSKIEDRIDFNYDYRETGPSGPRAGLLIYPGAGVETQISSFTFYAEINSEFTVISFHPSARENTMPSFFDITIGMKIKRND